MNVQRSFTVAVIAAIILIIIVSAAAYSVSSGNAEKSGNQTGSAVSAVLTDESSLFFGDLYNQGLSLIVQIKT